MSKQGLSWQQFCDFFWYNSELEMSIDFSRMNISPEYIEQMTPSLKKALAEMKDLEGGSIANLDENRMVGHYWLRTPELAPQDEFANAINDCNQQIDEFVKGIHDGKIKPSHALKFTHFILIGIGGSALGPQLVSDALSSSQDKMQAHFIDNTDPNGIDRLIEQLGNNLKETLVLIISKSGGTKETRNGMLEIQRAYEKQSLDFAKHAVAVTGEGSPLDKKAKDMGMLATFPMWDWVGGRTSLFSAVGMLPASLQGIDINALKKGATLMDHCTRHEEPQKNPATLLALAWYHAGEGRGTKNMVVLPYKDRLLLLSRYLQQLIMESIGKEVDRQGRIVKQGLTVYGNKGSTDQHAFVQQLRDGSNDFFATFIEIKQERTTPIFEVEDSITSGDYLLGFLFGTREALAEKGHPSLTISLEQFSPKELGMLIALYERTVGIYASLIDINAYHQPGVEAGKKAANSFLELQKQFLQFLQKYPKQLFDIPTIAEKLDATKQIDALFFIAEHLRANGRILSSQEKNPLQKKYQFITTK